MPSLNDFKQNNKIAKKKDSLWEMFDNFKPPNDVISDTEQSFPNKGLQNHCNSTAITLKKHRNNTEEALRIPSNNTEEALQKPCLNTEESLQNPFIYPVNPLQRATDVIYSRGKTEDSVVDKDSLVNIIASLSGINKTLLNVMIDLCNINGGLITPLTNITKLALDLNIPEKSVEFSIYRLKKLGLLKTHFRKKGPNGGSKYIVTDTVKSLVIDRMKEDERNHYNTSLYKKSLMNIHCNNTERDTLVSSSNIYKTTTTEEGVAGQVSKSSSLAPEWQAIDYSALEDYGFDESRLIQIYREYEHNDKVYLSTSVIQDSIDHFAFDLKYNDVAKTFRNSPVAVLTSMLKRGKPYSSITPEKVLSPQKLALLKYAEAKKIADERDKQLEASLQQEEMASWLKNLSADELLNQFYDPDRLKEIQANGISLIQRTLALRGAEANAKEYFLRELWPTKRKEILASLRGDVNYS